MSKSNLQQNDIYSDLTFENQGALVGGITYNEDPNAPDANIGVYFDTIISHSIQLNSNITDNWLENSTVVNDCIALPPITVTLSGLSGELVYIPSMNSGYLRQAYDAINTNLAGKFSNNYVVTDKLTEISALYPPVDNITQAAKNIVTVIEDNYKRYKKIIDNIKSSTTRQTRLQMIYENLSSLRISRTALTVVTPYTVLENMYIQTLALTQDNLNHISDISITLKQLNFSEVQTTKADPNTLAKFNQAAQAPAENLGKVIGQQDNNTIIGGWLVKAGADPTGGVRR